MAVNYLQMAFIALLSPDTTHCIKNFAEELLAFLHEEDSECQAKFQEFVKELYATLKSIMEVSQLSTMVN